MDELHRRANICRFNPSLFIALVCAHQDAVYDQEGTVNKFLMDDKGALLVCAWGLPPMAHTDDPRRATSAASQLVKSLENLSMKPHVGVTTGKVTQWSSYLCLNYLCAADLTIITESFLFERCLLV